MVNTQWFALSWLYVHEISDGRLPCALVQHIYYFEVNHKQMRTGFSIVVHRHVHWSLFHKQTVWLSCEIFSMSISVRTIQLRTSNGSHWTFLCLFFYVFFGYLTSFSFCRTDYLKGMWKKLYSSFVMRSQFFLSILCGSFDRHKLTVLPMTISIWKMPMNGKVKRWAINVQNRRRRNKKMPNSSNNQWKFHTRYR